MALTERLALLIQLDAQGAVKGLESVGRAADRNLGRVESKLDKTGQKMQKAGVGMLAAAGLAATGLYKAGQSAAELEQAVGGTEAIFKDASGTIDKFAKDAARNMGLSERAFREATTRIGGQLKGVGFDIDEAASKSIELTGVAADLAATFGGTTAEAVDALSAAFRGEADPAERFNLRLNQTAVNAKAVELGLASSTSEVDAQAKAQATLALITEQSSDALGQFGREAGTASGQMQIANAEFENAKASLGQSVAPIIADVAGGLADLAGGFTSANTATGGMLSKLATLGTLGLGAAGGLSFVVGKAVEMRRVFTDLDGPFRNASGGLSKFGKLAAGAAVAGLAVGLYQLATAANTVSVDLDDLSNALDEVNDATRRQQLAQVLAESWGDLSAVVRQTAESDVLLAEALIDEAEAAGVAADEIAKLREITDGKREADVSGQERQKQYSDEMAAAEPKARGLTDAITEQEEALQGLLDATLAQFDANLGYRQSVDDVEDSLAELLETEKEHGTNSEEYRDKLLDAEGALLDQAAAAVRAYEDTIKASGGTLDAATKTGIYKDELIKLRDSLAPGSPLRAALDGYIGSLERVPKTISTVMTLETREARVRLAAKKDAAMSANGTSFFEGGWTSINERGTELIKLPRGTQIYDANRTAQMLGGGSPTYITIQTGADPQAVVEAIKRYTRSNGPLSASLIA